MTAGIYIFDEKSIPTTTETYIDDGYISAPEGQITPPVEVLGGQNGPIEHPMPHVHHPPNPTVAADPEPLGHGRLVLSRWDDFLDIISGRDEDLVVDGHSLDLATIVAVAR